jgi:hypothetical protein
VGLLAARPPAAIEAGTQTGAAGHAIVQEVSLFPFGRLHHHQVPPWRVAHGLQGLNRGPAT